MHVRVNIGFEIIGAGRLKTQKSKIQTQKYTSGLGESGEQITVNTANSSQKWGRKRL